MNPTHIELIPADFNDLTKLVTDDNNKEVVIKALKRIYNTDRVSVDPGNFAVFYHVEDFDMYLLAGAREVDRCRRELASGQEKASIKVISTNQIS